MENIQQRSQILLNVTQRLSKIGGWEWDVENQTMFWTDGMYRIHDIQPSEISPGPITHIEWSIECYDPADRAIVLEAFRNCVENGQAYDLELPFTTVKGRRRIWIRTIAEPIRKNGVIVKVLGNLMDISDRKQAEEDFRDNEQRLVEVQKLAKLGHYVLDINKDYWTSSAELNRIFGIDDTYKKDIAGWLQIIHPDHLETISKYYQNNVLSKHQKFDKEYKITNKKTGRKKWVHGLGYLRFDENNNPTEIFGTVQDISERKQAEAALKESAEKFDNLFNNISTGIVICKAIYDKNKNMIDCVYEDMNSVYEKLTNLNKETAIGEKVSEMLPGTEPEWFKTFGEVVRTGNSINFEMYHEQSKKYYSVFSYNSQKDHFAAIFDDITERKQLEMFRIKAHSELEKSVQERTLDLQKVHNQLLHVEKLSAIGGLSASIAHEFNNPLMGVITAIEGVRRRASMDDEDAKLVDMAINECVRMKDLIKSLQDFHRPSSCKIAPMFIHAAVDSLLMLNKKDFITKAITVEKRYAQDMPQIIAVADQIKQVLLNLLNNAAYACEGGGTITISTNVVDKDQITLKIQDTGKGIKPEHINKIFDPFFTTKPAIKGTGLGLSVSYGIIRNHGGRIEVASEPDKGTTFTLTLPIGRGYNEK